VHEIGVVTPTHPARMRNGMTLRAVRSVQLQSLPAMGHFIVNDVNKRGVPWTRQTALMANPFEWTAFLDSDDWFKPHHLERLVQAQEDSDADYVYSWYELMHMGKPLGDRDPVFPPRHRWDPWDPADPRQTTITMLVRTDLAQTVGFWDPSDEQTFPDGHRVGEDWNFTLRCNELGKIYHIPDQTWYWEHHGGNTSGRAGQGDA
jgi:hypothetical protein